MNCSIFILGFLFVASTFAICQDTNGTRANASLAKKIVTNQSNSDAETFGGYLSAIGQLVGKNGNTVIFQPRIYDLEKLFFNKNIDIDTSYARTTWRRNLQINIGFTPNTKNLFSNPTNFQIGLTLAIINNKEIPLEDYQSVLNSYHGYTDIQDSIAEEIRMIGNDTIRSMIRNIMNHEYYSCLPKFLSNSVEKKFGNSLTRLMEIPKNLVDSLAQILPRRPQLVVDVNAMDGLGNRGEAGWDVKTTFSSYIFPQKKRSVDLQINISASYSFSDDTTQTNVNFNRHVFDVSAGINIIFFSRFELKPGVSYTNILSGLHANEHPILYAPTASILIKIVEKLVVSINWSYDSEKAASTTNIKLKTSLE